MNSSWKTTVFGLMSAIGASVAMLDGLPHWLSISAKVAAAAGIAGLGLAARDNNVTSEQAGAKSTAVPVRSGVISLFLVLGLAGLVAGCSTALNSTKIISVKQRCFGIIVETASTTSSTPNVKLGFVSTVWQMIPTSTNAIYAPCYADTFDLSQSANPFDTSISENTAAGTERIGTNGEASVVFPPGK